MEKAGCQPPVHLTEEEIQTAQSIPPPMVGGSSSKDGVKAGRTQLCAQMARLPLLLVRPEKGARGRADPERERRPIGRLRAAAPWERSSTHSK